MLVTGFVYYLSFLKITDQVIASGEGDSIVKLCSCAKSCVNTMRKEVGTIYFILVNLIEMKLPRDV